MTQKRFNSLAIIHEHKELTDKLDLMKVGNSFISMYEERIRTYGYFTPSDFEKGCLSQ